MPRDFEDKEIEFLLNEITVAYEKEEKFVGVFYEDDKIEIRFTSLSGVEVRVFDTTTLSTTDGNFIQIKYTVGPDIIEYIGNVQKDPPFLVQSNLDMVYGGDECRNAQNMNFYGTLSFMVGQIQIDVTREGSGSKRCLTNKALVSNNHVIGRSDAGRAGEIIWTNAVSDIAVLNCSIPLSFESNMDISTAVVSYWDRIKNWEIREIGVLNPVIRRPGIETIRKFGARTGLTRGSVTGKANIRVGKLTYNGVFITTGGFGCPGDSGSAVISNNNEVLGIFSWGDDIPCDKNPKSYFFTLVKAGTLSDNQNGEVIVNTEIA